MKEYPHIEYWNHGLIGSPIIGFDKIDGSNIRCEWSQKRGFYKFGTRNQLIDERNENFGNVIPLFLNKYHEPLTRLFKSDKEFRNIKNFTVFSEYAGEHSCFGQHDSNDIMDIILFDVWQHQKGWVEPRTFVKKFGAFGIPKVVYEGNLNKSLVEAVRQNEFNLKEGIMGKGIRETKRVDQRVWSVKMKTNDWFERLRSRYGQKAVLDELEGDLSIL